MTNPRLAILRATKRMIEPWARYLLTHGVSYREFDDVVRAIFVDVATKEFGIRGRPTNASRVAVLTGLTRKQVKKIRDALVVNEIEETAAPNQASLVLSGWHSDHRFVNTDGTPKPLPFEDGDTSFSELVRKYGKDIPPRAMLRELKRTNAVEEMKDGRVRALNRYSVSDTTPERKLSSLAEAIGYFMSTVTYNLMNEDTGRLERRVTALAPSLKDLDNFDELARPRAQQMLEDIEDSLISLGHDPTLSDEKSEVLIGAGVYFFAESTEQTRKT
ncbi:MAG: DUF6502 family protein [Pseudomonadota bacterium]